MLNKLYLQIFPLSKAGSHHKLHWLLRLRIHAILVQIPLTFVGRTYGYLDQGSHLIFMASLILFLIYSLTLKEEESEELLFQVSLDVIFFTILLNLSGGALNPFYSGFYVFSVLGGLLTSHRGGFTFFIVLNAAVLLTQTLPAIISNNIAILFRHETFPYLLSQIAIPSVIFLLARSFGKVLERTESELAQIALKTEKLDRLRTVGALSAGFSHEFASPLHAAKIRLQRLERRFTLDPDIQECSLALNDCERVLKKMNSSQLNNEYLEFEELHLPSFLDEVLSSWAHNHPEIVVKKTYPDLVLLAPKIGLAQALLNVLDNAAHAMKDNGIIHINVFQDEKNFIISVTDEGPGFNPEVLKRLGEPFNTDKENGTGLGLYSSKLFMESINGGLKISSEAVGTKIQLHLRKEDA